MSWGANNQTKTVASFGRRLSAIGLTFNSCADRSVRTPNEEEEAGEIRETHVLKTFASVAHDVVRRQDENRSHGCPGQDHDLQLCLLCAGAFGRLRLEANFSFCHPTGILIYYFFC